MLFGSFEKCRISHGAQNIPLLLAERTYTLALHSVQDMASLLVVIAQQSLAFFSFSACVSPLPRPSNLITCTAESKPHSFRKFGCNLEYFYHYYQCGDLLSNRWDTGWWLKQGFVSTGLELPRCAYNKSQTWASCIVSLYTCVPLVFPPCSLLWSWCVQRVAEFATLVPDLLLKSCEIRAQR